jgi:hypothetical protein
MGYYHTVQCSHSKAVHSMLVSNQLSRVLCRELLE